MVNMDMANKGMGFEREVKIANEHYSFIGKAVVQKISTPWKVVRKLVGGRNIIVSATPEGKSTVDFRGTVKGGVSISFDCKETQEEKGLPLSNIEEHQVEYMRSAIAVGETTFILCLMKAIDRRFYIPGNLVIEYWDRWKANKGKKGYNYIPLSEMKEVYFDDDLFLDYLEALEVR